uniref:Uncharacterized protein n=1 Tax=Lotharella globosa TaxID=91324 RepID=A0A7S3Z9V9_9EUKA|eukprot:CAMPEP_0167824258 /NCGR_PEP_ID=MMETSP0112_2-20121227/8676_1 /TAXON_ID=91324 /ORGANISM="Lotharella globosa, Strain CCCM811" /LENGTH=217 /DNA_ID=CAMNT_0007726165 /DNA_START=8 /DNA_END=661 /DNA_ORIENTATION=+
MRSVPRDSSAGLTAPAPSACRRSPPGLVRGGGLGYSSLSRVPPSGVPQTRGTLGVSRRWVANAGITEVDPGLVEGFEFKVVKGDPVEEAISKWYLDLDRRWAFGMEGAPDRETCVMTRSFRFRAKSPDETIMALLPPGTEITKDTVKDHARCMISVNDWRVSAIVLSSKHGDEARKSAEKLIKQLNNAAEAAGVELDMPVKGALKPFGLEAYGYGTL